MSHDVVLDGCRPEPLGSYLKALGVFRLVAEQLDPGAAAHWSGDRLVLTTTERPLEDVVHFLVDAYRPTPIVSPWNGGSGFHPKDNTEGITAVEQSTSARLRPYRAAVARARELVAGDLWRDLAKDKQVTWCRNELPDEAQPWLDAAVVLSEGGIAYPPLLGTGGNVGRLDFSNNFMQRLTDVLCLREGRGAPKQADSEAWLRAALCGTAAPKLRKGAVGQFDPGAAGGTNAPSGGSEESLVNPWDFVLAFEGALLFASGAARRMGAGGRGKAAMPFTFDATPVGYGSAVDGESAKGELWAPLWSRPAGLGELRRLLGEGRMEWRGGHARRGIDAARAAASLGVDRGITGFGRHVFVERMGQAMLAVPVGRIAVADRRRDDVPVLGELDEWVDQVRRVANPPAALRGVLRRLDRAMFELAGQGGDDLVRARRLQDVLVAAAELERTVARSRSVREAVPEPVGNRDRRQSASSPRLPFDAVRWVPLVDDRSPELRLAVALASGRDRWAGPGSSHETGDGTVASLLRAVEVGARGRYQWRTGGRPVVPGLGTVGPVELLGALVQRRAVDTPAGGGRFPRLQPGGDAAVDGADGAPGTASAEAAPIVPGPRGIDPAFAFCTPAHLGDLGRFLAGEVDDERLERLLGALLLLQFRSRVTLRSPPHGEDPTPGPAAALVLPFFHGQPFTPVRPVVRAGQAAVAVPAGFQVGLHAGTRWPRLLTAGRVAEVIGDALHRLRVARLERLVGDAAAVARGVDGPRLLAATAFRLSTRDVARLLTGVAVPPPDRAPIPDPEGET